MDGTSNAQQVQLRAETRDMYQPGPTLRYFRAGCMRFNRFRSSQSGRAPLGTKGCRLLPRIMSKFVRLSLFVTNEARCSGDGSETERAAARWILAAGGGFDLHYSSAMPRGLSALRESFFHNPTEPRDATPASRILPDSSITQVAQGTFDRLVGINVARQIEVVYAEQCSNSTARKECLLRQLMFYSGHRSLFTSAETRARVSIVASDDSDVEDERQGSSGSMDNA